MYNSNNNNIVNKRSKTIEYSEISSARISNARCIVISDCSRGGYIIAQRMEVTENNHTNKIYLKGAFRINDIHGLYELRDALNYAIQVIEEREEYENSDIDLSDEVWTWDE